MSLELKPLIGKLNSTCRRAFELAAELCVSNQHYSVEIEHLLLKLLERPDTDVERIFSYYSVDMVRVSRELSQTIARFKRGNTRTPTMSPYILALLKEAWLISSLQFNEEQVRSGSMLLAIIDQDTLRGTLLESAPSLIKIPRESLREDIHELLKNSPEQKATAAHTASTAAGNSADTTDTASTKVAADTPALDQFTIDLTDEARQGKIDEIEGRDGEIRQIIDILTRRRQNNPILTGDAGVGKTAVAEGFALRIARSEVPPTLKNVSLRTLDLGLLQAGAGVKGEFENRVKSVISEVKSSPQPIILFIDEAHTMIGAGAGAGQGDVANLLKPALARGDLRTIAATTWAEYKKYFEKDPALTRRFQVVKVGEPDEDDAIRMLRSVVKRLENHHQVMILDEAIRDAVRLSARYISGRQLPDKAVSVLDTACARVAIAQNSEPPVLEATRRRIERSREERQLLQREQATGTADHKTRLEALETRMEPLKTLQADLRQRWQDELQLIQKIREQEQKLETTLEENPDNSEAQGDLIALKTDLSTLQAGDPMIPLCVDGRIIAQVISAWTGIPVGKMLTDEVDTILNIKQHMAQRIIGQSHALDSISRRIQTYRADLDDPGKPVGVFMLAGPSGVGKTETAVTLAELLYGGEHNMITINMSEYQEAYTVSSLKGAPPGYVGHGKGGVLTEAVRRNPYSVVLLDEVEKAHPDVLELFYQVFDKGVMEDGDGVVVDFKNTLILLTTNLGTESMMSLALHHDPGIDVLQEAVRNELLSRFKPAFLGRMVLVPYYPLGDEEIRQIVRLKLDKLVQRFADNHKAHLHYDDGLVHTVTSRCTEVDSGARNIDHILTHTLLPALSVEILERGAQAQHFSSVQLSCDEQGEFSYAFDPEMDTEEDWANPDIVDSGPGERPLGDLDSLLDWLKSGDV
ncbi:type VI secretion system ATPase TssH [Candidatus Venteria ishoeyi]|uniref:Chaperone protein ClpB n=1 Tax=Candidatus Venteria ishoeyi TaxID=1899563 RepID=A0A1H6F6B9_9GAMM|nr:type VI secretion system ATPase TssH [Candidatus Venteria ishoeyi]SEH05073.1 Chaperone protein ClpB [Candidatus Venteria ishoeyi]